MGCLNCGSNFDKIIREMTSNNTEKEFNKLNTSFSDLSNFIMYPNKIEVTIADVSIIVPNKVVEVTFEDGTKTKSVCNEKDQFSLEQAISICISKRVFGGTSEYNKIIKNAIKLYNDKLKKKQKDKEEAERIAKHRAKRISYKKRRAEKIRNEKIAIQKEAYIQAMEYMNGMNK